jgi:hypothetical protein
MFFLDRDMQRSPSRTAEGSEVYMIDSRRRIAGDGEKKKGHASWKAPRAVDNPTSVTSVQSDSAWVMRIWHSAVNDSHPSWLH